jgi:thioredoxin 1
MLQPQLAAMLRKFPTMQHIKIEDGKGKLLGRSFRVKLWPNLVFLRDGKVKAQMARPEPEEVLQGLQAIGNAEGN